MMLMKIFDEHDYLGTSRLPARSLAVGLFVVPAGFLTVVLLNVGTLWWWWWWRLCCCFCLFEGLKTLMESYCIKDWEEDEVMM